MLTATNHNYNGHGWSSVTSGGHFYNHSHHARPSFQDSFRSNNGEEQIDDDDSDGCQTPVPQTPDSEFNTTPLAHLADSIDSMDGTDSKGESSLFQSRKVIDQDRVTIDGFPTSKRNKKKYDEKSHKSTKSALEKVADGFGGFFNKIKNSFKGNEQDQRHPQEGMATIKAELVKSQEKLDAVLDSLERQNTKSEKLDVKTDRIMKEVKEMKLESGKPSNSPTSKPKSKKYQCKPTCHFLFIIFHYVATQFKGQWEKIVIHMLYECEAGKEDEGFVNKHIDILCKNHKKNNKDRLEEFLWQWHSLLATERQKYDVMNVLAEALQTAGVKAKEIVKFRAIQADMDTTQYACMEDSYLHYLAGKFSGKEQKGVGFGLDFTSEELDHIEQDYRGNVHEANYQILLRWKRRNACYSHHFLRAKLKTCFTDVGRSDIAESLK